MTPDKILEDMVSSWGIESYKVHGVNKNGLEDWYIEQLVIEAMRKYARIKCLEAIRNTRHKTVDILMKEYQQASVSYIANQIQNIQNEDVLPEL